MELLTQKNMLHKNAQMYTAAIESIVVNTEYTSMTHQLIFPTS